jgi:hypothetical protein
MINLVIGIRIETIKKVNLYTKQNYPECSRKKNKGINKIGNRMIRFYLNPQKDKIERK